MENPNHENPIIQSWQQFATNNLLLVHLFEFINLTQLAIIQIVGIVEDEKTLFHIDLHEVQASKLVGRASKHVICMFVQDFFTKDIFPFQTIIANWNDGDKVKIEMNA